MAPNVPNNRGSRPMVEKYESHPTSGGREPAKKKLISARVLLSQELDGIIAFAEISEKEKVNVQSI
jgi:hypothetical protein